ncbi:MAG: hypothetical protein Q4A60_00865 [Pasteurellaceae bacterium]|nr:hypothetical protein [Pasteurellaceae bacterium]
MGVHFYLKQQFANQQQQQITLKDQLTKQTQLLTSLQQHIQTQRENNFSFTQINQQIQTILTKYQTQTEQWQWSLEQENQLYLTFNQQTTSLLNILYELNQIPALYSKEITLTKLHQAKLVQFNGTFMLSN